APATEYYVETRPNVRLNILFDFDKSNIKAQYKGEVQKAADFLAQYPDAKAIIEGHTDSKGSDAYNQKLSERRANEVRNALIKNHGISPARLTAQGFGESRPVATNDTDAGRQENRRVMVVIPNE
ncbi:OmpA family protein, partial [Moraxella marmotae]|uniref:OmpA family protein n=1 Tax=Moraxella marmotae TaxID=3344520 RepID=UPI0035F364E2